MPGGAAEIAAWRPGVPGIVEVFHARFADHAYPRHTHDTWTLLIVDDGVIRYDLDRHAHGAQQPSVTILPPHVAHDGRSVTTAGFRKRVLYLDATVLDDGLIGAAVDRPTLSDRRLRATVDRLHGALGEADDFTAECRLASIAERIRRHLGADPQRRARAAAASRDDVADHLRAILDAALPATPSLADAARSLDRHPAHLVRAFGRRFGLPPHRYVIGRRIDDARRLLLDGRPSAEVAAATGFADQAHLTRHFVRHLGTTPGRFARVGGGASATRSRGRRR